LFWMECHVPVAGIGAGTLTCLARQDMSNVAAKVPP
jgi:hypothetical protein